MSRVKLLPPALARRQAWVDLAETIDTVFGSTVDSSLDAFASLREPWTLSSAAIAKVDSGELIAPEDLSVFEKPLLIRQVNMLGLPIADTGGLSASQFSRLNRYVSQFWYSKGSPDFMDFLSYCLDCEIGIERLWTTDYSSFVSEGDPSIDAPIWDGGTWYPTTHVNVYYDKEKLPIDESAFISLFYDVANYVLVMYAIISNETYAVTSSPETDPRSGISSVPVSEEEVIAANFSLIGFNWASVYTGATSGDANFTGALLASLLAEQSGWPGTFWNSYLTPEGTLADAGSTTWDAAASFDSFTATWDGPSAGDLMYECTAIDVGIVRDVYIVAETVADGNIAVFLSVSSDNSSWSPWTLLTNPTVHGRHVKARWVINGPSPALSVAHLLAYPPA